MGQPETPRTDHVFRGVGQLPEIAPIAAREIVSNLRGAEVALQQAQARYDECLQEVADTISDGEGWTFDEIQQTDLREVTEITQRLIDKGHHRR